MCSFCCDTKETVPRAATSPEKHPYDAFMKNMNLLPSLLATLLLLVTHGLAQLVDSQVPYTRPELIAARCRYAPTDNVCAASAGSSKAPNENDDVLLAQFPDRRPMPPVRAGRPIPPPYAAYPGPSMSAGNRRHALIGALIGFGVVTAIAAKANGGIGASLALGVLGGGIGAGMGLAFPPFPVRYRYSPNWPDAGEQASGHKHRQSKREPSGMVALRSESPHLPGTVNHPTERSANMP